MDINALTKQLDAELVETDVKIATINLNTVATVCDAIFSETLAIPPLTSLYSCFKGSRSSEGKDKIKRYYDQWKDIELSDWLTWLLRERDRKSTSPDIKEELNANIRLAIKLKTGLAPVLDDFLSATERLTHIHNEIEDIKDELNSTLASLTDIENERDELLSRISELKADLECSQQADD